MSVRRELLALDDVSRALNVVGQSHRGIRPIPIERIVGSVDRSNSFDRQFRPLRPDLRERLRRLGEAFPDGGFPPILVYEVGGAYFVADGHHRVALSRRLGAEQIDAEIIVVDTPYELDPGVDIPQLLHTEQQRVFMEQSGLGAARPEADITFSRPQGYPELLEVVKAHGYDLMRRRGTLLSAEEIAADWYDHVYLPGVGALDREGLHEAYAYKTDADLFLWVYQQRRVLLVNDPGVDFAEAARAARRKRISRRTRRSIIREQRAPLRRRGVACAVC